MAHFAKVEDGIVTQVIVIDQETLNTGHWGDPALWVQTSYNTQGGVHANGGTPLRKNFAGIGYLWLPNGPEGGGFVPPSPYPSWTVMNSFSYLYEAPVPMPVPNSPPYYHWDEATLSWVANPKLENLMAPPVEEIPFTEI